VVDPLPADSSPDEAQADSKSAISKARTLDFATRLAIHDEPSHGYLWCNQLRSEDFLV